MLSSRVVLWTGRTVVPATPAELSISNGEVQGRSSWFHERLETAYDVFDPFECVPFDALK